MAIIENAEIWFCKLDPKRPNASFNKENPTWECQIRTKDKNVKKKWEDMHLRVKVMEGEDGVYYRVNLKKKSKKEDGSNAAPVKVVDGGLNEIDPNTIGNGSVGNIRVFQYDYESGGKKGVASMLMAIQLTKHILYTPKPRDDDFTMTETQVVKPEPKAETNGTPKAPVDQKPESAF